MSRMPPGASAGLHLNPQVLAAPLPDPQPPPHTWSSIRLTRDHSRIPSVVFSALGNEGCLSGGETLRL